MGSLEGEALARHVLLGGVEDEAVGGAHSVLLGLVAEEVLEDLVGQLVDALVRMVLQALDLVQT